MKKIRIITTLILLGSFRTIFGQIVFGYTGGPQNYTVPVGVTVICFTVNGAQGMANQFGLALGGLGGRVVGSMNVVAGQVFEINVGGGGFLSNAGGFNGGANGGVVGCCAISNGGGGGGASDIRGTPFGLANRIAVGGGGGGTGGNRNVGCAPGCGGGGGGGYYGGGGGGAYGGSPGFGGSQVAGGAGGASCCGCPLTPLPGAAGTFGVGGLGGGMSACNNQAANNPGCTGGIGGALTGGQGPNCTGGTGCPSTWAGASGGGGSNFASGIVIGPVHSGGVQTGNGLVILIPNCCQTPTLIPVANPTAICQGQSSTLTVTGAGIGGTYTWTPGAITGSSLVVSPSVTTIYTVAGTNTTNCIGTQTVLLTVNPSPTIIATPTPTSICVGQAANVAMSGAFSYTTNVGNLVGNNIIVSPTVTTIYTVTGTSSVGCIGTSTFQMVVNPLPTITAVPSPTAICSGFSSTVTFGGASSYTTNPGNIIGNNIIVSPLVTTIYTVTGATSFSCVGTRTFQIVVNPTPTITATPTPSAICIGQSANVVMGGALTYTTNVGNIIGNSIIVSPTVTTIYTVTGTSSLGCIGTKTFQIVVNPLPIVTPTNNSPICQGGTVNLSVGAGISYTWTGPTFTSNLQNPSLGNATPSMSGVYTVSVTNAFGCIASGTTNVVINPVVVITPTNTGPYCAGATISLSVAAAATYTWTGPNAFGSNLQNPTIVNGQVINGGVYTVSVTAVGGCMSTGTTNVVVNPAPSPTATSNSPVCLLKTINLFGSGGTTYTWSGPGGFSSNLQNPSIAVAQASNAGVYTLSVTNGFGCVSFTTTTVVVNPLPVIVVNNPLVCVGQNILLTATGGTSYAWSGPLGFISAVQNPTIPGATTLMTGAYTVVVTSAFGCTASAVSNVTVITLPQPSITANSPLCVGATLSFTGSGGGTYAWTGPNGFGSPFQNPLIPNVSLAANGVYTLVVTAGTCSNSITYSVTVNPLPVPTATSNSPVCLLKPINFTGTGGTTYTWSGPGGYSSNAQNPSIAVAQASNAGTYTLTVTNANGCTNSITTNVVVNPLPVPIVSNLTVCVNQPINLTASGGTAYAWSGPLGYTSLVQNPTIPVASTLMSGGYTVVATSAFGCTASAVANVTVITLPVAGILSNTPCVGATLSFTGSGGAAYNWTGPNGFASLIQNPNIAGVTLAAGGVYTLVVTAGTCSNSTTANVVINPLPVPTATSNSPVCLLKPINFTGTGGTTYTWSGPGGYTSNAQNPSIAVAQASNAGTYTLTVTNANGCVNFTTTTVVVNPLPVPAPNNPTVCVNQPINLTSSGGVSYAWSGPLGYTSLLQNPTIPAATTLMTGAYTVVVTSAFGCTASAVANVTVLTLPVAGILSNTPCVGSTLNLTGSGGAGYSWSGPNGFVSAFQNPNINNVTLAAGGIYTLVVTAGTCSNSTTANVVINPLPVPTASSNSSVCKNQILNLTGAGGVTYTWSGPGGYSSNAQNPVIASAQPTNAGSYVLTVTNGNGCTNTVSTMVVVNPLPNVTTGNIVVCENTPINLFANGALTYTWTGPLGFASNSSNPTIPFAVQNMSGSYIVNGTSALGCVNSATASVTVLLLPVAAISNNTPCIGSALNLGGNGGVTYLWAGPNSFSSTSQNPNILNTTMLNGGTYSLMVSAGNCSAMATQVIVINPLPTPTLSSNSPVCLNQPINLIASGGNSYAWSGPNGYTGIGNTPSIPSASNLNAGTYTAIATDANNCTNTVVTTVSINPLPVIAAVGSTLCAEKVMNLSATGGITYAWVGPAGFSSASATVQVVDATTQMSGQYTITVTDANGCFNTALTNVQVNPIPTITMNVNTPVCANQTVNLSAGSLTGLTYIWNGPNGFFTTQQNPSLTNAGTNAAGGYTVTVTDNIGCSSKASIHAIIYALPLVTITSDKLNGCVPVCITFSAQSTSSIQSSLWKFGDGNTGAAVGAITKCYTRPGAYDVISKFTDVHGCANTSTFNVEAYPIPVADFNFEPTRPITNEMVEFTDASRNAAISAWTWNFSNQKNKVVLKPITTMAFEDAGNYAVALIVMSDKGCKDTIVKSILVGEDFGIFVPNAFTPNGDGLNDTFEPKGFGIVKYELNIFDRWGEKLFSTKDFTQGWDGSYTIRGEQIVKEDVYIWHIKVLSVFGKQKELSGKVTITK